jgi:hypothetical protein
MKRLKRTFPINRKNEDAYLEQYWNEVKGMIITELPAGRHTKDGPWPKGSKIRRIDGVRVLRSDVNNLEDKILSYRPRDREYISSILTDAEVEIIEIKKKLNRVVIGQVVVGATMMSIEYNATPLVKTILCKIGDPALEIICKQMGIRVWKIEE